MGMVKPAIMKGMVRLKPNWPEIISEFNAYPKANMHGKNTVMSFYLNHIITTSLPKRYDCLGIVQKFSKNIFDDQYLIPNPIKVITIPIGKKAA
jgi:hypothetical protein